MATMARLRAVGISVVDEWSVAQRSIYLAECVCRTGMCVQPCKPGASCWMLHHTLTLLHHWHSSADRSGWDGITAGLP